MQYFKDINNNVYAYDADQVANGYGSSLTPITKTEANTILNPPLTPEEQQLAARRQFVTARTKKVANIKVTTAAGNTFDGDETSQTRMVRAIIGLERAGISTIPWVLADNSVIQANVSELSEALALAGQAQSDLWIMP